MGVPLRRNSKYHQGIYKLKSPEKYIGKEDFVEYKSGLELRYFKWIDMKPDIIEWGYEMLTIPYRTPFDDRPHRYYPDLYIKVRQKDGAIKKFIVELKPKSQTIKPKKPTRQSARFIKEMEEFVVNQCKWKAADELCKKNNATFLVLTEEHIKIK